MKLNELKKTGRGRQVRYVSPIADVAGAENYELVVAGPDALIKKSFEQADIEVRIDPEATREKWVSLLEPVLRAEMQAFEERARLESLEPFFEPAPPPLQPEQSLFVSLRRLQGEGSLYVISIPLMWVGGGQTFGWMLPPVCTCFSTVAPVFPIQGDIDLFLSIDWLASTAASSVTRGTSAEQVTFSRACWPWTHFVPIFETRGFTSSFFTSIYAGASPIPWP